MQYVIQGLFTPCNMQFRDCLHHAMCNSGIVYTMQYVIQGLFTPCNVYSFEICQSTETLVCSSEKSYLDAYIYTYTIAP